MSIELLSLSLDILILIGLSATIYFALKLSKSLNNFRSQRKVFEKTMKQLNQNIEQAHDSLSQIKGFSGSFDEEEVQLSFDEARALLDELKIMSQSGNSLADRLEYLASQSRYADQFEPSPEGKKDESGDDAYDEQLYSNIAALEQGSVKSDGGASVFSIHDREFGDADSKSAPSQAEQELFQALKKNKKQRAG